MTYSHIGTCDNLMTRDVMGSFHELMTPDGVVTCDDRGELDVMTIFHDLVTWDVILTLVQRMQSFSGLLPKRPTQDSGSRDPRSRDPTQARLPEGECIVCGAGLCKGVTR